MNIYVDYARNYERFIPLMDGTKQPNTRLAPHGHKDALYRHDFPESWEGFENYGLVLDDQYIVVDFDAEHPERRDLENRLPDTWKQTTRKGTHWLYSIPPGYKGRNLKMKASDGTILGDIKTLGYIVCPDSVVAGFTYMIEDVKSPVMAPSWLLETAKASESSSTSSNTQNSFDSLPDGARDNSLHSIASLLRRVGYSQNSIETALTLLCDNGLVEQPEGREVEKRDIQRIAKSAARYDTETDYDTGPLIPANAINGSDIALIGPPTYWWLRGFVPKGELVTMFGKGGIGKSTFASRLASNVTQEGGLFGVVAVEEPFARFVVRSVLCGADRSKIYGVPNGSQTLFPRDAELLKTYIEQLKLGVLFFDSIYTHFEPLPGLNMAERSRLALSSLAEIGQSTGCTIIGNFHENKMGNYLGSVEMENVARVMLKLSRKKNKPLRVHVEKTNKRAPDHDLEFPGIEVIIADPSTGEVQLEIDDEGLLVPEKIIIAGAPRKIEHEEDETAEVEAPESVLISDLSEPIEDRNERIRQYKRDHPGATVRDMAEVFEVGKSTIARVLGE